MAVEPSLQDVGLGLDREIDDVAENRFGAGRLFEEKAPLAGKIILIP